MGSKKKDGFSWSRHSFFEMAQFPVPDIMAFIISFAGKKPVCIVPVYELVCTMVTLQYIVPISSVTVVKCTYSKKCQTPCCQELLR